MPSHLPFLATVCIGLAGTILAQSPAPQPLIGRHALRDEPRTLDPQVAYDTPSVQVINAIYDTLLEYHPLKSEPWELRPCMLVSMPKKEASADGRMSYLCELKPDIRFHDDACFPGGHGRAVTASDVHYTFQRLCDPAVDSAYFSPLDEVVEGMTEARARAEKNGSKFGYDDNRVSGIEVLDARRFRIRLRHPYPQIIHWLAMPCTAPVAREAVEFYRWTSPGPSPASWTFHPVGTGAFQLRENARGERIHLVRSPGYATTTFPNDVAPGDKREWLKPLAGKPLPLLDEVEIMISRDNRPINDAFLAGKLDTVIVNKDARSEFFDADGKLKAKLRDRGMTVASRGDVSTFWTTFNLDDPLVGKNKKLRQAIACAIDAQAYVRRFYDGIPTVATQLLPRGIFGHEPERKSPVAYDLEKAKRLLSEAGYPGGRGKDGASLEISFLNQKSPWIEQEKELITSCMEAIGLRARIETGDFVELLKRRDRGAFQISMGTGWGADYPDPENFFGLFHSRRIPPNGTNAARYRNPEFDQLFDKMAWMENSPERLTIIRKLNDLLAEDCPVAFTMHKQAQTVAQPWFRRTNEADSFSAGFKFLAPPSRR